MFEQIGRCTHTIGLYKSGHCLACGIKVMADLEYRARYFKEKKGYDLDHLVINRPEEPTVKHIKE